MSRKAKFTPEEKEQAVIDYLEGNKSRTQICGELCISSRTIQDWALIYNKPDAEVDELERLKRENLRLKRQLEEKDMVVELLKKVKEFEGM